MKAIIDRIRRNHGLEHATLHVLSGRHPQISLGGHSDYFGFWILGDLPLDEIRMGVQEAYQRLQNGESQLAIHPNCGTNLVAASFLAGVIGMFAFLGSGRRFRDKLDRLPLAVSLISLALLLSRPLGMLLQGKVTTSGAPGGLQVVDVYPRQKGWFRAYRVVTRDAG